MSCNYSNDKISNDEFVVIEQNCKNAKMLDNESSVKDCISQDEAVVFTAGITFEQLQDFFESFELVVRNSENLQPKESTVDFRNYCPKFLELDRKGWSMWGSSTHKIKLFGLEYTVIKYTWGGAQECPFQNREVDPKYNGYKYGASDYIIYRETTENGTKKGIGMHIGSLLFHQIAKHHFFQDHSSDYRVDPKKLIDMFDLRPETCYRVPVIEKKYRVMTTADGASLSLLSPATPSCMDVTNSELWSVVESNEEFILYQRIAPQNEQEKLANYCVIALKEYPESSIVHQDISYPICLRRNYYSDEIRIVKKPIQEVLVH